MSITDIVNVVITKESDTVSRVGFSTMLFITDLVAVGDRVKSYSSLSEVLDDYGSNDLPAVAATSYFSQNPHPTNMLIGRLKQDVDVTVDSAVENDVYTVTIDGTDFSHTAGAADTITDIRDNLLTAIQGGSTGVTATSVSTDGINITHTDVYSLSVTGDLSFTTTRDETLVEGFEAIIDDDDDFYGVVLESRTEQDVKDLAANIETKQKIFGIASSDSDIITNSTSDFFSELNDLDYARTFGIYYPDAATTYPEAAWFGNQLSQDPGSTTWAFKTLNGISTVKLTLGQRNNVYSKNANTYETRSGANITREGKVFSDEYIDIIVGIDWLKARMQERVFGLYVSSPKVVYTDPGISLVESKVRAQLDQGIQRNFIAANPKYTVTMPKAVNVPSADKQNRVLKGVSFNATLAGAIHSADPISGIVII